MRITVTSPLTGVLSLLLAGCVQPPPAATCAPGLGQPMVAYELFFGRAVAGRGDVTEREWIAFIEDTVTPALPGGYTIFDAFGAWRGPDGGRTMHEASKVILAVLPDTADGLVSVNRIRSTYQSHFNQHLVGMTAHPTCGTF